MARKRGTPQHVEKAKKAMWAMRKRATRMAEALPSNKTDAELIAEAIADGRVTKCPTVYAHGCLIWTKADKL